jgi:hypothetical protein
MLVHAHAAGDAVHDDAEPLLRHFLWDPLLVGARRTMSCLGNDIVQSVMRGLDPRIHLLRKKLIPKI